MKLKTPPNKLRYTKTSPSRATIHRHYLKWRSAQSMPLRCDNEKCRFHAETLIWNSQSLGLILDHANGNNTDNRPENLRLLCPNCDSQLETRGGRNRGRIQKSEGGFAIVRGDGKKDYIMPAESGQFSIQGHPPTVLIGSTKRG
jgi:hypothetical protein